MERRRFMLACALSAPALAAARPALASDAKPRYYRRALLVDTHAQPLQGRRVAAERNFIFHYPFAGTPCFLLNLGKALPPVTGLKTADAEAYQWPGGVGADRSLVGYSAICTHRLTYPTREISFISYRAQSTAQNRYAHVIHCCSEHSQYDPAAGAKVVAGPAPQPLAAILLDYDAKNDRLYAIGTLGGELFDLFFARYEFRLALEHQGRARAAVEGTCVVSELEQYCKQQVKC
jgi:arsenite oxidase small subunit